ncbi:MAG: hypothetical protein RL307_704, partial [Pseudomonadota bacterium]
SRNNHLDDVLIKCELQRQAAGLSEQDTTALARDLAHRIKTFIGISTQVTVLPPEGIARTQVGKARRVFDHRPALH